MPEDNHHMSDGSFTMSSLPQDNVENENEDTDLALLSAVF